MEEQSSDRTYSRVTIRGVNYRVSREVLANAVKGANHYGRMKEKQCLVNLREEMRRTDELFYEEKYS